jgi:hypothetical protein
MSDLFKSFFSNPQENQFLWTCALKFMTDLLHVEYNNYNLDTLIIKYILQTIVPLSWDTFGMTIV